MFDIVTVMVMLFLGRGSFSVRLRFFREGFKFFWTGGDAFGSVLDFFGRGWDQERVGNEKVICHAISLGRQFVN